MPMPHRPSLAADAWLLTPAETCYGPSTRMHALPRHALGKQVVEGGQPLTTEEVRKLIRAVDRNGDGKISCRELAYFLLGGLEANKSPVEMAVGNSAAEKAFPVRVSGPSKKSLMHD